MAQNEFGKTRGKPRAIPKLVSKVQDKRTSIKLPTHKPELIRGTFYMDQEWGQLRSIHPSFLTAAAISPYLLNYHQLLPSWVDAGYITAEQLTALGIDPNLLDASFLNAQQIPVNLLDPNFLDYNRYPWEEDGPPKPLTPPNWDPYISKTRYDNAQEIRFQSPKLWTPAPPADPGDPPPGSKDPASPPTVSVGNTSGTVSASTVLFPITLSLPSVYTTQVAYRTVDGTAKSGYDYIATAGTMVFAAGEMVKYVSVSIYANHTTLSTKTFDLTLASPSKCVLGTSTGTCTLTDNAPGDDPEGENRQQDSSDTQKIDFGDDVGKPGPHVFTNPTGPNICIPVAKVELYPPVVSRFGTEEMIAQFYFDGCDTTETKRFYYKETPPPRHPTPEERGDLIVKINGPYRAKAGEAIKFSSAGTYSKAGKLSSYTWHFGDGSSSAEANPVHTYSADGLYAVTLRVQDSNNLSASARTNATVNASSSKNDGNYPNNCKYGYDPELGICFVDVPNGGNNTISFAPMPAQQGNEFQPVEVFGITPVAVNYQPGTTPPEEEFDEDGNPIPPKTVGDTTAKGMLYDGIVVSLYAASPYQPDPPRQDKLPSIPCDNAGVITYTFAIIGKDKVVEEEGELVVAFTYAGAAIKDIDYSISVLTEGITLQYDEEEASIARLTVPSSRLGEGYLVQVAVDPIADEEEEEEIVSFTLGAGKYLGRTHGAVQSVILPAQGGEGISRDYPFKALTVVRVNGTKTRMVLFGNGEEALTLEERAGTSTSWFNNNAHIALSTSEYASNEWLVRWTDAGFTTYYWLSGSEYGEKSLAYGNFFALLPGKTGADLTINGPDETQNNPTSTWTGSITSSVPGGASFSGTVNSSAARTAQTTDINIPVYGANPFPGLYVNQKSFDYPYGYWIAPPTGFTQSIKLGVISINSAVVFDAGGTVLTTTTTTDGKASVIETRRFDVQEFGDIYVNVPADVTLTISYEDTPPATTLSYDYVRVEQLQTQSVNSDAFTKVESFYYDSGSQAPYLVNPFEVKPEVKVLEGDTSISGGAYYDFDFSMIQSVADVNLLTTTIRAAEGNNPSIIGAEGTCYLTAYESTDEKIYQFIYPWWLEGDYNEFAILGMFFRESTISQTRDPLVPDYLAETYEVSLSYLRNDILSIGAIQELIVQYKNSYYQLRYTEDYSSFYMRGSATSVVYDVNEIGFYVPTQLTIENPVCYFGATGSPEAFSKAPKQWTKTSTTRNIYVGLSVDTSFTIPPVGNSGTQKFTTTAGLEVGMVVAFYRNSNRGIFTITAISGETLTLQNTFGLTAGASIGTGGTLTLEPIDPTYDNKVFFNLSGYIPSGDVDVYLTSVAGMLKFDGILSAMTTEEGVNTDLEVKKIKINSVTVSLDNQVEIGYFAGETHEFSNTPINGKVHIVSKGNYNAYFARLLYAGVIDVLPFPKNIFWTQNNELRICLSLPLYFNDLSKEVPLWWTDIYTFNPEVSRFERLGSAPGSISAIASSNVKRFIQITVDAAGTIRIRFKTEDEGVANNKSARLLKDGVTQAVIPVVEEEEWTGYELEAALDGGVYIIEIVQGTETLNVTDISAVDIDEAGNEITIEDLGDEAPETVVFNYDKVHLAYQADNGFDVPPLNEESFYRYSLKSIVLDGGEYTERNVVGVGRGDVYYKLEIAEAGTLEITVSEVTERVILDIYDGGNSWNYLDGLESTSTATMTIAVTAQEYRLDVYLGDLGRFNPISSFYNLSLTFTPS